MSEKITLPHHLIVSKWKEEKVIKWLKKVNLDDCIPAFEIRHIDGAKLLELTEQKLFTYQDLKIKHRKKIAKCVQECKSQASNAKRIARSLKHNNGSHSQDVESNGGYDFEEDSDYWDSDFEDDTDDEVQEEQPVLEVNNNSIGDSLPAEIKESSDTKPLSYSPVSQAVITEEKPIPKPPDVPVISKAINGSSCYRNNAAGSIPRPPLKRPPSQPPPPPVPQGTSQSDPLEDYEIPIVSANLQNCFTFPDSSFLNSMSNDPSVVETYEIVEPQEENYEIVDPPTPTLNMTEKPMLPPRLLRSPDSFSPPPLPQKPQKLKEGSPGIERSEGIRTFSRPKLPIKPEGEVQPEVVQPSSLPSNMSFISTLMGRKSSLTPTSSPKSQHKYKDDFAIPNSTSARFPSDSLSPSSPDNDCLFSSPEVKKTPLPPLPHRSGLPSPEDLGQNMATRPLPPVPQPKETEKSICNKKQDIQLCPWFQEIEREDAEAAVKKLNEAGSFVVRPSKRAGKDNPYSLTVLHEEKLFHLNIRQRGDNTFALGKEKEKEKTFASVSELITYHLSEPILLKNRGEAAGKTILGRYPDKT